MVVEASSTCPTNLWPNAAPSTSKLICNNKQRSKRYLFESNACLNQARVETHRPFLFEGGNQTTLKALLRTSVENMRREITKTHHTQLTVEELTQRDAQREPLASRELLRPREVRVGRGVMEKLSAAAHARRSTTVSPKSGAERGFAEARKSGVRETTGLPLRHGRQGGLSLLLPGAPGMSSLCGFARQPPCHRFCELLQDEVT